MLQHEQQARIRSSLKQTEHYALLTFTARMAMSAVRSCDLSILKKSTIALAIVEIADWRDLLITLAIINDCSARLGLNFEEIVAPLEKVSAPDTWDTIAKGFLPRDPKMKSPKVFGYVIREGENGIDYVWNG